MYQLHNSMSVTYMGKVRVTMKFKSNAKYKEKPEIGSIFTLKDNSLGISIHKYAGCGDALFLNSKAHIDYQMPADSEVVV